MAHTVNAHAKFLKNVLRHFSKRRKKEVSTKNAGMRQQTSKMPYQWVRKKSISKAIPIPLKVNIGGRALRARQRLYNEKVCARELGAGGCFACQKISRSSLSRHMWLVSENERKKHKKRRNSPQTMAHATVYFPDLLTDQRAIALLDVCSPFYWATPQR